MGPMGMPMGGGGGRPPMGRPPMGARPPMGGRPPMDGRPPIDNKPPMGESPLSPDHPQEEEFDLKQMEKESEEMTSMFLIHKDNAVFTKTSGGLMLNLNESVYKTVELIETFPFTEPYAYLSVRNPLEKNKEIGLIENLENDFDTATIRLIKEYLDTFYHMPVIEKILQVKESGGFSNFTVMTNFGETQFSLRSNNTCITTFDDKRLIIQDSEGNRFEIPDKNRLNPRDLKKLDIFM